MEAPTTARSNLDAYRQIKERAAAHERARRRALLLAALFVGSAVLTALVFGIVVG